MGDRAMGLGRPTTSLESVGLRRDLGVGGHTVVIGWAWPVGCQSSSAGQPEAGGRGQGLSIRKSWAAIGRRSRVLPLTLLDWLNRAGDVLIRVYNILAIVVC